MFYIKLLCGVFFSVCGKARVAHLIFLLLVPHLSTANQSNSERRGHGYVCVCSGKPEGHGAYAEGDAGPGEGTFSVLCSKRKLYDAQPVFPFLSCSPPE